MRLFAYYALHSFLGIFRKLMKTWVLIFVVVCMLIGGGIGFLGETLSKQEADAPTVEQIVEEKDTEPPEEIDIAPFHLSDYGIEPGSLEFLELVSGLVIIVLFVFDIVSAEKNASRIFNPADVHALFSSPMRPQSVLMFRVTMQMALALFLTVYFFIEIPLLCDLFNLQAADAIFMIIAWGLSFLFAKLLQVYLYLIYSDHPGVKKIISYSLYGVFIVIAVAFLVYYKSSGLLIGEAAVNFFASNVSRFIPVWGQLKALVIYSATGNIGAICISLVCVAVFLMILVFAISRTKGDYYEDAMMRSEELAEAIRKAQESKGIVAGTKRKDYADKLIRNEFNKGFGANVFYYKAMYNRRRFAAFGVLTKTTVTYLAVSFLVSLAAIHFFDTKDFMVTVFALAVFVFYRSLGNPLAADTSTDYFRMIPESSCAKLFYSLLGGTANCALDLIPAYIIGAVIMEADPVMAVSMFLMLITLDLYATTVGTFINLSVPVQAGKMLKQMVQVMFIYFGLIPDAVIVVIGVTVGWSMFFVLLCCAVNIAIAAIFWVLAARFTS